MATEAGVRQIEVGSPEWDALVADCRRKDYDRAWRIGDAALLLAPMPDLRSVSGGNALSGQHNGSLIKLRAFADEIELTFGSVQQYRSMSSAWPVEHREPTVSPRAHRELMGHPDRFRLIHPMMTLNEAAEASGKSTSARGGQPAPTLLGVLAEIIEIKRRIRVTFRTTTAMELNDSQREQILGDLTEVENLTEQFRVYLTAGSVDEAIMQILQEG